MGKNVILTPDEARTITELLLEDLDNLGKGESADEKRRLWRLVVKLDKAEGANSWAGLGSVELPVWVRKLLHQTFAPDQVAPKKTPATAHKPYTPPKGAKKPAAGKKTTPPKDEWEGLEPAPHR